jgi:hypothetical protein
LDALASASLDDLPVVIKFILQSVTPANVGSVCNCTAASLTSLKIVTQFRQNLRIESLPTDLDGHSQTKMAQLLTNKKGGETLVLGL